MFDRLRIVTKLMIGFGMLLIIVVGLASAGALGNLQNRAALSELMRLNQSETLDLTAAKRFEEARMSMWMALATGDATYWANADLSLQIVANALDDLKGVAADAETDAKIKHWGELIEGYKKLEADLQGLHGRNEALATVQGKQLATLAKTRGAEIANAGEQLRRGLAAAAETLQGAAERRSGRLAIAAVGVGLVSVAFGAALGFLITRSIRRGVFRLSATMARLAEGELDVEIAGAEHANELGEMARRLQVFQTNAREKLRVEAEAATLSKAAESARIQAADRIAETAQISAEAMRVLGQGLHRLASGDLSVRLGEEARTLHGEIVVNFDDAVARLQEAMAAVVGAAESIDGGMQEIGQASQDLSARADRQAADLRAAAEQLEAVVATVAASSAALRRARAAAETADRDATQGAETVAKAVAAMGTIAQSSNEIGRIIGVIDEIAFQTNLLALNAGVEAARAGDSGRGFAVVASEVRALAQRSAQAAKEIKTLVTGSAAQVTSGVGLVDETGRLLERLLGRVSEINTIVAEVANGAEAQSAALERVNAALGQIDETTQSNAEAATETNAAARALTTASGDLAAQIAQFRLAA